MRLWISLGLVAIVCAGAVAADAVRASADLQQLYPNAQLYQTGDRVTRAYGTILGTGASPELTADQFVRGHAELFGTHADELLPGNGRDGTYTQPIMYEPETGTYKFTLVHYYQAKDGIPVYGADLRLLVRTEADYPLVLAASSLRDIDGFRVPAGIGQTRADNAAFGAALALVPSLTDFSDPELVIWAGNDEIATAPTVALVFIADNYQSTSERPEKWRFVADAATGQILYREDMILFTDVSGTINGLATQGPKSGTCAPEVATPMPYAAVNITSGGSGYADVNGNFTLTNAGITPVTVNSPMTGRYFTVSNVTGSVENLSQSSVTPPGPVTFLHNAANTDAILSQVNAYIQANVVRDWVLAQNPAYPTIATQTGFPLNVNSNDSTYCPGNAWYDYSSLNFCNPGGVYPNTAYSNVVHHEYGHHIVDRAGSGQDQYGEGYGDSVAVLLSDDPILGYGFEGNCNAGIRTADNAYQYPCTSDIHTCAQLLSGCIWSARNELIVTEPVNYLAILSRLLVNSTLVHTGGSITPQICIDFLTLDDNDGDLLNGTPHFTEITTGFGAHNMWAGLPPQNDSCSGAMPVCPNNTYSGTTTGKTVDGSASCGSSNSTPDVWYLYRPQTSGTLHVDTCAAGYDTVLSVHTGCPGTTANQVGCNDNTSWFGHCGFLPTSQSSLDVSVSANQTYYIRISGNSGATGSYGLDVTGPACVAVYYALTVNVSGQGSVALNPPGGSYSYGTSIELTPNPAGGWAFDHWEGALTGAANPGHVIMYGNRSVIAVFVQSGPAVCRGDCNCDGVTNFADIDYFVESIPDNQAGWSALYAARHGGANPPCTFANCDVNNDGHVNFADIDPFVALIPSNCP